MADDKETGAALVPVVEVVSSSVAFDEIPDGDDEAPVALTLGQLEGMGFIMPLADPRTIRAAFQYRQKLIGSMLDPNHDFLYTIPYTASGEKGQREHITTSIEEAKKYASNYGTKYKASVKKSGIAKLASALKLQGKKIDHLGFPTDPKAEWCQITYEITHAATGRVEQGVGVASVDERPGRAFPKHHLVALADTRAYGRGVLRLAGFGELGAEELMTGPDDSKLPSITAPVPEETLRLPASTGVAMPDLKSQPARPAETAPTTKQAAPAAAPASKPQPVQPAPQQQSVADTITDAQAAKLSQLAKQKLGTTDKVVAWLTEHAKASSSRQVRERDYSNLMKMLEAMEAP